MSRALKLFFTLFFTYAFFTNAYLTTNDASRFALTAAIVEEGSFEITDILPQVLPTHGEGWVPKDFVRIGDKIYSDKAPAGSFIAVPVYFIASRLTHRLPVIVFLVSLFTAGLATALSGVLLFKLGKHFGCGERQALAVGLTYGLCSMALFYGGIFFSSGITAFFVIAGFHFIVVANSPGGWKYAPGLAGMCLSAAIMSDYYAGIASIMLLAYSWRTPKSFARVALPFAVTICLLLLYNYSLFGNPFETGYKYSYLSKSLHSKGFYGITFPTLEGLKHLSNILFAKWGFFFTNMPILFSIAFFPAFLRFKREAILVIMIFAGYLFMNMSMGWFDAYSARFFMPALPILFLPLFAANLDNRITRDTFFFMAGFSLMINLIGADTFMPQIKSLAKPGMQNLLGAWLASRDIKTGYYTLAPVFVMYAIIWIFIKSKVKPNGTKTQKNTAN